MNIFRYKMVSMAIINNAKHTPDIDMISFWSELDALHMINIHI